MGVVPGRERVQGSSHGDREMNSALSLALLCALHAGSPSGVAERVKAHTEYLASDELKGRGAGSEEIRIAAAYIAGAFEDPGR